jgi:ACR3 family arsenite transporter
MSAQCETTANKAGGADMGSFERYLTVWVFLCIIVGIALGHFFSDAFQIAGGLEVARVNLPVAVLVWLMIIPMLLKIDLRALKGVSQHWRGVGVTLFVNWAVKPFSMAALAWLFIGWLFAPWLPAEQIDSYIAGLIILAAAPCTAMVFVWSHLSQGEPHFTLSQVALNDVIMIFAFAPVVGLLLGLSAITVPWDTLLLSVLIYIVVPLSIANLWRRWLLNHEHGYARLQRTLDRMHPVSLIALLATLVLLFGFQGEQIIQQPLIIVLLAVPLIGASNFFELAVATAIALFGFESGAALATVVGVLIEVPVMLVAVGIVNRTRCWYETREGVVPHEQCCPADMHLHAGH